LLAPWQENLKGLLFVPFAWVSSLAAGPTLSWLAMLTGSSPTTSSGIPFDCEQEMRHAFRDLNLDCTAVSRITTATACTSTGQNLAQIKEI